MTEAGANGAIWLASYPKSGNTWLRCLLDAYQSNGYLDINNIRTATSDGGATIMQGVSPMPLGQLGLHGELLLRPAALLNLFCRMRRPFYIKTHFANLTLPNMPPCIPRAFTDRAVYVLRDPRSVVMSFSKFFGFPVQAAVEAMNNKDLTIGNTPDFSRTLLSSWSNHVASWTAEKEFPVHAVKYEDMVEDTAKELTEIIEFLGWEVDASRVARAVRAAESSKLQAAEKENGFNENPHKDRGEFFNGGGTRWKDELGPKWAKQIEGDHRAVMEPLGY